MNRQAILTRTALLLALMLIFQSLRFFIPIPPLFSTLLIGTLVNATLIISLYMVGLSSALFLSVVAPLVAYFQQLLLLPVFIAPVAAGNMIYVSIMFLFKKRNVWVAAIIAAGGKTIALYAQFFLLLHSWLTLPPKIVSGLLFVMSWPQLFTAFAGIGLAVVLQRRLLNN